MMRSVIQLLFLSECRTTGCTTLIALATSGLLLRTYSLAFHLLLTVYHLPGDI